MIIIWLVRPSSIHFWTNFSPTIMDTLHSSYDLLLLCKVPSDIRFWWRRYCSLFLRDSTIESDAIFFQKLKLQSCLPSLFCHLNWPISYSLDFESTSVHRRYSSLDLKILFFNNYNINFLMIVFPLVASVILSIFLKSKSS